MHPYANPHGPKKIWVPRSTPILFDIGVGSHNLDGGCDPNSKIIFMDASLSRDIWWEDQHALET